MNSMLAKSMQWPEARPNTPQWPRPSPLSWVFSSNQVLVASTAPTCGFGSWQPGLRRIPMSQWSAENQNEDPESHTHVTNPKVVVEVLSPGTHEYDRGKLQHYQQVVSL